MSVDANLRVSARALLADNYAYVLTDTAQRASVVVDPSDDVPVLAYLKKHALPLRAILCTHHHYDHVGGVEGLRRAWGDIPVYGSAHDLQEQRIPHQSEGLLDNAELSLLEGALRLRAIETPGHTLGALCYLVNDEHLFTGDTLFLAGCGRLFEGTPALMHHSLQRIAALPEATRIYCGHEYTEKNLAFAAHAEPDNAAIRERLEQVRSMRAKNLPTVPATLAEELQTNPFLRARDGAHFAELRSARNDF